MPKTTRDNAENKEFSSHAQEKSKLSKNNHHIEIERGKFLLDLYQKALLLSEKELNDYFLDHAVSLTGSKIGFFHFVSTDQKTIMLTAWNGEALKNCVANYKTHYSIELAGNWVDCVRLKRPIIYNDYAKSPNQKGFPSGHVLIKRFMSIPIFEGGKIKIVFGVGNKIAPYTEDDIVQLQLIANELSKIYQQRQAEDTLRESEKKYRSLFENMLDGFAYCRMIFDEKGKPVDFEYLEINDAFGSITGLKREAVVGKRVTKAIPGIEKANPELFEIYGRVALTCKEERFEIFFKPLSLWLNVSVYCPAKGYFAAIFQDITERKKSEEALQKQASLIDLSPDAIIGKKLDDTITFWSQGAQNLYGWTKEEALGKKSGSLLRTKFPEPYHAIVKALLSEGRWSGEKIHKDKFGHEIIVDSRWLASCNNQNEIEEILETNVDVTQRKKLEMETQRLLGAVQQERDRVQSLLNSINDEVWFADNEKKFTLANPSAVKEFKLASPLGGVDVENLAATLEVYRSDGTPRPVEEAPPLRALIGEVVKNQIEVVRTPVKEELRYRQVSASPVRDAKGTIIGSVSVVRDVTELKNLEKQLQEYNKNLEELVKERTLSLKVSEEKYRTLFDSIDEGFCIIEMVFDSEGKPSDYRFLEINASFERQTGLHDAKGKLMRTLAPNHESYWFETYGKVALTRQPVRFSNEAKALNRYYDVFAFPVGDGNIRNVGILFNDISQRKNLEKQLKDSERLAAIGATAGMVGHDIRNPLQAIISDVYLAKTELASISGTEEKSNIQESLAEIEKNIDYINKIVADLQDFARPLNPHEEEADIKLIINDLLSKNELPETIKVSVNVESDAIKVVADSTFINRIMYNLITNAVQAMPHGGKLTIHAFKEDTDFMLTVKDTGVGISEKVRGKLFTPMFTTKSKGQGFGLAVIKRMTEALGGTVSFESQEGKGTTFTIRLPPKK